MKYFRHGGSITIFKIQREKRWKAGRQTPLPYLASRMGKRWERGGSVEQASEEKSKWQQEKVPETK